MLNSYPSIYALGHAALVDLLKTPVIVEEKIDGSQFSFGIDAERGLGCRSKGCILNMDAPEGMFQLAVNNIREIAHMLTPGWTYRGEYLQAPKHNSLIYARVPRRNIILFDVNTALETYLSPEEKRREAERIGLECVPMLFQGMMTDIAAFRAFLETTSALGGQKVEGVVVKPQGYALFGRDKKCVMGKFVSEAFKETHAAAWKESNPGQGDILDTLGAKYTAQARWMKAVQHFKEAGKLESSPRDIGALLKEIPADVLKECEEQIKRDLFAWAWPHLRRQVTRGFPEWYKEELLKKQFDTIK